jgi:carbamate kinase
MEKKSKTKTIVIAIGGNALNSADGKGGYLEQQKNAEKTAKKIAEIAKKKFRIIITHGNGPQVGNILLQQKCAKNKIAPMPLGVCVAQSQGQIGTILATALNNELRKQNLKTRAIAIVSHVLVDPKDPALMRPTKPIGVSHKLVPSPLPIKILEINAIKHILQKGFIPIVAGGGGIPVIKKNGKLQLIDAVIDKDFVTQILANELDANEMIILTKIKKVAINFKKSNQKWLDKLNVKQAKKYLQANQFAEGSMKPKIQAAIKFLEKEARLYTGYGGQSKKVIIGNIDKPCTVITKT